MSRNIFEIFIGLIYSTFNIPAIINGDTPLGILPNRTDLYGKYTHGSIPNITGYISTGGTYGAETFVVSSTSYSGAFMIYNQFGWHYLTESGTADKYSDLAFDASRSSDLYQNDEVDIKSCGTYMFYIIHY